MSELTKSKIRKGELQRCYVPVVLTGLATQDSWRIQSEIPIPVPRSAHT